MATGAEFERFVICPYAVRNRSGELFQDDPNKNEPIISFGC